VDGLDRVTGPVAEVRDQLTGTPVTDQPRLIDPGETQAVEGGVEVRTGGRQLLHQLADPIGHARSSPA
jgi:hypothetical protein